MTDDAEGNGPLRLWSAPSSPLPTNRSSAGEGSEETRQCWQRGKRAAGITAYARPSSGRSQRTGRHPLRPYPEIAAQPAGAGKASGCVEGEYPAFPEKAGRLAGERDAAKVSVTLASMMNCAIHFTSHLGDTSAWPHLWDVHNHRRFHKMNLEEVEEAHEQWFRQDPGTGRNKN